MKSYLPPRVAIECIDDAIVLSRRRFWPLFRLGLIPFLAYTAAVSLTYNWSLSYWVRMAIGVFWYGLFGLVEAATILGGWELLHGRELDPRVLWQRVLQRVVTLLFSTLIRVYLILFGLVVFIAPGLYFLAIYFAVPAVIMVEGLGLGASLKRSRSLALGSIRGVLLSTGMAWVLVVVIAYCIPRILTLIGIPISSPLRVLVSVGWAAVVVPFRSVLAARVYLEIRARKEGYDLQHLMGSLPDSSPTAPALEPIRR